MASKAGSGPNRSWILTGWLGGALTGYLLAIPSYRAEHAAGGWSRTFAVLNLVFGALIGAVGGGFAGGAFTVFRKGQEAGWRYLRVSALVVAATAVIEIAMFSIIPGFAVLGLLLLLVLGLLSPILWRTIAAWSIRRGP